MAHQRTLARVDVADHDEIERIPLARRLNFDNINNYKFKEYIRKLSSKQSLFITSKLYDPVEFASRD